MAGPAIMDPGLSCLKHRSILRTAPKWRSAGQTMKELPGPQKYPHNPQARSCPQQLCSRSRRNGNRSPTKKVPSIMNLIPFVLRQVHSKLEISLDHWSPPRLRAAPRDGVPTWGRQWLQGRRMSGWNRSSPYLDPNSVWNNGPKR